ncbi:TetR/AcrR family transcriptional regulator [Sinobacterium norvegicum]|uniref:TetR/AcrR family transcriptional regulator n=1 Tax=Sinobacterium norvegicum TaxID=1641715 RepID=UPI001F3554F9|nr:TetR/AcrR family transcriptional regulator [Sinobacterium norvegicum]
MSQKPPATAKKRGRPAKLSRLQILDAAFDLLQREPSTDITITGLAKTMKVAPMSLYTHIENRDDLLESLSNMVLEKLVLEIDPNDHWQQQLRGWISSVHNHLYNYPQVVKLLGQNGAIPIRWLGIQAKLYCILDGLKLDDKTFTDVGRWLARETVALALLENGMQMSSDQENAGLSQALDHMDPEDIAVYQRILPHVSDNRDDSLFNFNVERIIDALVVLEQRANK